jgi:hypothetical protein
MAIPWMIALKVIPWGDVIEHAPRVLSAARKLLERQRSTPPAASSRPAEEPAAATAPPSLEELHQRLSRALEQLDQQEQAQAQLTQTVAELAEQNARLVSTVEVLRMRSRLLLWAGLLLTAALAWVAWS